jgi:hypothetical protein
MRVNCKICCLSFEGRLDQETFELFVMNTMPEYLLMISSNGKKISKTQEFCTKNELTIKLLQAPKMNV